MATKKRTKKTPKPSKAAKRVAELMLTPPPEFTALMQQMQHTTRQLDAMDAVLKQLYTVVTGKPFPSQNVLVEPAPPPVTSILNG